MYSEAAVEFLLGIHSIQVVGQLLLYPTSRQLLIRHLKDESLTLTEVLVAMATTASSWSQHGNSLVKSHTNYVFQVYCSQFYSSFLLKLANNINHKS